MYVSSQLYSCTAQPGPRCHYLTAAGMTEVRFLRGVRKTPGLPHRRRPGWTPEYSCLRTTRSSTRSRAAKTAASTLEDVRRVKKEKYTDDAKNMDTTFTPLVCPLLLSRRRTAAGL
jgi:hypothetical protein